MLDDVPVWCRLSLWEDYWRSILRALLFLIRMLKYGVREEPIIHFTEGIIFPSVSQTKEDRVFDEQKINQGLKDRTIEQVTESYALECACRGMMVSSCFTTWTGEDADKKGRFVINLKLQSGFFRPRSTPMEKLPSFSLQCQRDDTLMSFDIQSGYHHLFLHPSMGD